VKARQARSPSATASSTASTCFSTGTDSPVRVDSSTRRPRAQQTKIRGHAIARLDQHDLAGHDVLGSDCDTPAVTDHRRARIDQVLDRLERLLRPALLDEADQRVDQHDAEDDERIDEVADDAGECRRAEQDVDQRIVELQEQAQHGTARLRLRQPVSSMRRQPGGGLGIAKSFGRRRERRERGGGLDRVPRTRHRERFHRPGNGPTVAIHRQLNRSLTIWRRPMPRRRRLRVTAGIIGPGPQTT
jgi:hypothetical protein